MINTRYVNNKDKCTIEWLLKLARQENYCLFGSKLFKKTMRLNGWEFSAGSYKGCYIGDNLIVKFPLFPGVSLKECSREYEQWLAAPRRLKRYLPRIYAYEKGVIIQERVALCKRPFECISRKQIEKRFYPNLCDTKLNHGHKNGVVKFFDWVYFRHSKYLNINSNIKLPRG